MLTIISLAFLLISNSAIAVTVALIVYIIISAIESPVCVVRLIIQLPVSAWQHFLLLLRINHLNPIFSPNVFDLSLLITSFCLWGSRGVPARGTCGLLAGRRVTGTSYIRRRTARRRTC